MVAERAEPWTKEEDLIELQKLVDSRGWQIIDTLLERRLTMLKSKLLERNNVTVEQLGMWAIDVSVTEEIRASPTRGIQILQSDIKQRNEEAKKQHNKHR